MAFDTIGIQTVVSDRTNAAMVAGLLGLGYQDRILLSHDLYVKEVGRPAESGPVAEEDHAPDYGHIQRTFLPWLREAGVSEEVHPAGHSRESEEGVCVVGTESLRLCRKGA